MKHRIPRRLFGLTGCFVALIGIFVIFVQPWFARWGATDYEVGKSLAGDEIIPSAASQETRAITINAPVAAVWPWLAQLGRDRGGFYSFDLLENLVGCDMPVVDRLVPEHQGWKIGDKLWMYPENKAGGTGFATLRTLVPGRVLGFGTRTFGVTSADPENGSWVFVLEPLENGSTRLIIRGRIAVGRSPMWRVFDRFLFEPMHFVMERRMMIGLKQLAEGQQRERTSNHLQSALWMLTFGLSITAVVLVFRQTNWLRALVGFSAAAVVFQLLTFAQPPIVLGTVLVGFVAVLLSSKTKWSVHQAH